MSLENHRELHTGGSDLDAGFQWEFHCQECDRRWKSPFKPYRMGQISGLFGRLSSLVSGRLGGGGDFASVGLRSAREKALEEAQQLAASRYVECSECRHAVCLDCIDNGSGVCVGCLKRARNAAAQSMGSDSRARSDGGALKTCPNCQQPHAGGRFCAECGFDLASTHKSCPACNAMALRQARFCVECGHAF